MFRFVVFVTVIISVLFIGLTVVIESPLVRSSAGLGRLVFTDYPKPDHHYTVDVFDLEQGSRSALAMGTAENGFVYAIDDQHVYFEMCFVQNNPFFCTSPVGEVVAAEDIHKFAVLKDVWQPNYGSPRFAPDNRHIAMSVINKPSEDGSVAHVDIYVMNANGEAVHDVTPQEENDGFNFAWSPDSQQIVFACGKEKNLCIVNIISGVLIKQPVPPNSRVRDMRWSPDDRQIVFSLLANDSRHAELYLTKADGSDMHRLIAGDSQRQEAPIWSPDSTKITFRASDQNNGNGEIYVVDADGNHLHNLSVGLNGSEFESVWSPDSRMVAFIPTNIGKVYFLYIVDVERGMTRQIATNSTLDLMDVGGPELFWIP